LCTIILDEFRTLLHQIQNTEALIKKYLSLISEQKRSLISPEMCNIEKPFPAIYQKYNEVLLSRNAIDYDDILFFAYLILLENLRVVELYNIIYPHIIINESHYLNYPQYCAIQALCGHDFNNIMMVGDENQSIPAFNGSSSKYMSEFFIRDFNPTIYNLDYNYRSAKQIIQFSNSLTGNLDDISKYFYNGELSINSYENELAEALSVRHKIESLVGKCHDDIECPLDYNDFAVIARNKYSFSHIEKEFNAEKIPFFYKRTQSGILFETDFMEAFELILRLILNPNDLFHRQKLCQLTFQNFSANADYKDIQSSIEQMLRQTKFAWLNSALPHISATDNFNFDHALNALNNNMPSDLSDDVRYFLVNDIEEWRKHWNIYKKLITSEKRTLKSFRIAISLGRTQEINEITGVTLLTAHTLNGSEFEVIFVIGLTEGTFPDYRAIKNDDDDFSLSLEKINMNLAVTSAKRLCYLSYPKIKKMPWGEDKIQNPSRFISCQNDGA
ncbi:MAG: ATP-dependent helicase, partial [Deltaproteobacteria bacterium]|nr:ATP-dependent helicase [Deltaproteobacteria bacterium]